MCGIFGGYLNTDLNNDNSLIMSRIKEAQDSIHHRGPDDEGLEVFDLINDTKKTKKQVVFGVFSLLSSLLFFLSLCLKLSSACVT